MYPLGSWFGGGAGDYAGRMALVVGLQAGLGLGVWGVGVAAARGVGRRWFGWGRL